jgi:hypothetical protein
MIEGFEPVVVDTLGGLCTLVERSDLPVGLSPNVKNVEFFPGGVKTRGGFASYINFSPDTYPVRAIYEHVSGLGNRGVVTYRGGWGTLDSNGTPFITALGAPATFSTMKAASLYGRAYMCLSDGKRGLVPPIQVGDPATASNLSFLGMSSAGAAGVAFGAGGLFTAGRYFVIVAFETATGYITGATVLNYGSATALNGTLNLTGIPLGPTASVVRRRIFVSLPDSFDLYNPAGLTIDDNTTTTLSASMGSAEIAAGLPYGDYITLQTPTAHLGVIGYNNRLVMWGGDGKIDSFYGPVTTGINPLYSSIGLVNLDFGADVAAAYAFGVFGDYRNWTGSTPLGTGSVVDGTGSGQPLNFYRIGSAGAPVTGLIEQGWGGLSYRYNRDLLGTSYLNPGRKYGIRARVRNPLSAAAGNLKIILYEANSTGPTRTAIATMTVSLATTGVDWAIFEADGTTLTTGQPNVAISIYGDNLPAGKLIDVANIEIYDTDYKRGFSSLDISRAFDPESLDTVNGRVSVSPNDGEETRNAFVLRGNLYICKEKSLYLTQDNGQEPSFWNVELVSSTVGTPSVHGVGMGDGWVVIAARDGLYMFDGGAPNKISQEIQPTWDNFDWSLGERIYVAVDTQHQTIVIGGPTASSGFQQLRLNYLDGFGSPVGDGNGRKWSFDTRVSGVTEAGAFNHAWPITTAKGLQTIAYAVSDDSQRVVIYSPSTTSDFSGAINSVYETAPIGGEMKRSLFGFLAMKIRGSGSLLSSYIRPDSSAITLPTETLSANPLHDVEIRTHATDTQLGVKVSTNASGSYFIMKRLAVWLKRAPFSSLRGY